MCVNVKVSVFCRERIVEKSGGYPTLLFWHDSLENSDRCHSLPPSLFIHGEWLLHQCSHCPTATPELALCNVQPVSFRSHSTLEGRLVSLHQGRCVASETSLEFQTSATGSPGLRKVVPLFDPVKSPLLGCLGSFLVIFPSPGGKGHEPSFFGVQIHHHIFRISGASRSKVHSLRKQGK